MSDIQKGFQLLMLYENNQTRITKDLTPLVGLLNEALPIVKKWWPTAGPAINDLLPILEEAAKELKG